MCNFARVSLGLVARCFRSRRRLLLENLALRQQLSVLKRRQARPKLSPFDKLFWVLAYRFWTDWKRSLLSLRTPDDVYASSIRPQSASLEAIDEGHEHGLRDYRPIQVSEHPEKEALERLA
jgi:hypothetical protein